MGVATEWLVAVSRLAGGHALDAEQSDDVASRSGIRGGEPVGRTCELCADIRVAGAALGGKRKLNAETQSVP